MTSRPPPSNARSLDARLRALCRERGIPEGRARRLLGVVVVGQLLARADLGVVKGASNIEVRVGTASTRVSSDLDTISRASADEFRDTLASALREGWAGFTGDIVDRGPIPIPGPVGYRPHRLVVKLRYTTGNFTSLTVEVSPEEIGALDTSEAVVSSEVADWLEEVGLPTPDPVPTLPLTHQIAQKLHACTSPDTDGWINDRVHDLVDLQLALEVFEGDFADVRTVASHLFAYRRRQPWPPTVTGRDGWVERYPAEADGLPDVDNLDAAIAWTNQLIATIDAATTG